jgi:hypothetical protein
MVKYKIYVHDKGIDFDYPIHVEKEDFFELCEWLNGYCKIWNNVTILGAEVQDTTYSKIADVHFLDVELKDQYFYQSTTIRLLEFNNQLNRKERVVT